MLAHNPSHLRNNGGVLREVGFGNGAVGFGNQYLATTAEEPRSPITPLKKQLKQWKYRLNEDFARSTAKQMETKLQQGGSTSASALQDVLKSGGS